MAKLRTALDVCLGPEGATCPEASQQAEESAEVLAGSFLVDDGDNAKTRTAAAKVLVDEFRDWRALVKLADLVRDSRDSKASVHYDVDFLVATIPDYVDSNSGWVADQSLAAIQSGMTHGDYLFDRVKLIDWSRSGGDMATVLSNSRLHERQPGVLIFRRVAGTTVYLQIVMLALERPTAGIHQEAATAHGSSGVEQLFRDGQGPSRVGSTFDRRVARDRPGRTGCCGFQQPAGHHRIRERQALG